MEKARKKFQRQLEELNQQLTAMGELCETAIIRATDALATGSTTVANEVIRADAQIDQAERDIEHLCLNLLLRQAPIAGDLRQISAALKMITDLERIGDQAADIAEIVISAKPGGVKQFPIIIEMAKETAAIVAGAISAYVRQDLELASRMIARDTKVDALFDEIRKELIDVIVHEGQGATPAVLDLLMIAKYLERIGDHATNVAEWVSYSITGVHDSDFDTKPEAPRHLANLGE